MAIRKRCDSKEKHGPHEWHENNFFRRYCPGRRQKVRGDGNATSA